MLGGLGWREMERRDGEDGCASGGRYQEQSEADEGTSLAVMEADVLWSNGSCLCLSVCLSWVRLEVSACGPLYV